MQCQSYGYIGHAWDYMGSVFSMLISIFIFVFFLKTEVSSGADGYSLYSTSIISQ